MEPRSAKELLSGVLLAVFGLYVTIESARFSYVSEDGPGPGFLPFWLGIALCGLALSLAAVNLWRRAPRPLHAPCSWLGERRALSGWLALMGAIILFPLLGFSLSLVLLTLFLVAIMEGRSFWSAVVIALGIGIGFQLIFVVALGLSLPKSPLGF
jgi:hypothetical protein